MDNLNTHTLGSLHETFPAAKARELASRLEIHSTSKHESWLHIARIGRCTLSRQCLFRRIPDIDSLNHRLGHWKEAVNADEQPVNWQFTTSDVRIKLRHPYPEK